MQDILNNDLGDLKGSLINFNSVLKVYRYFSSYDSSLSNRWKLHTPLQKKYWWPEAEVMKLQLTEETLQHVPCLFPPPAPVGIPREHKMSQWVRGGLGVQKQVACSSTRLPWSSPAWNSSCALNDLCIRLMNALEKAGNDHIHLTWSNQWILGLQL